MREWIADILYALGIALAFFVFILCLVFLDGILNIAFAKPDYWIIEQDRTNQKNAQQLYDKTVRLIEQNEKEEFGKRIEQQYNHQLPRLIDRYISHHGVVFISESGEYAFLHEFILTGAFDQQYEESKRKETQSKYDATLEEVYKVAQMEKVCHHPVHRAIVDNGFVYIYRVQRSYGMKGLFTAFVIDDTVCSLIAPHTK